MTGYEIIKGNINFTGPERIGLRFDRIAGKGDLDLHVCVLLAVVC